MQILSDKITHHGYQRYYRNFFANVSAKPVILEIGVDNGDSLALWSEYFEKPKLYAIDIDHKAVPDWVNFACVDQSNTSMLDDFARDKHDLFDVIVDDGSHVPSHQLLTLKKLWSCLKPGGCYIIEDIETCYWKRSSIYGYRFDARIAESNIIKKIPSIIDVINSEFLLKASDNEGVEAPFNQVDMVMAGANCICLVKKNNDAYGEFYGRSYRCASAIDSLSPISRVKNFLRTKFRSR